MSHRIHFHRFCRQSELTSFEELNTQLSTLKYSLLKNPQNSKLWSNQYDMYIHLKSFQLTYYISVCFKHFNFL